MVHCSGLALEAQTPFFFYQNLSKQLLSVNTSLFHSAVTNPRGGQPFTRLPKEHDGDNHPQTETNGNSTTWLHAINTRQPHVMRAIYTIS